MQKTKYVGAGVLKSACQERGITLIALIITIIVMLILVGVSISIALNTGLFDSAGKATQDWKAEQEHEQQIAGGQVTVNNKVYNSIDDYVKETQKKTISFSIIDENGIEHQFQAEQDDTWVSWVLALENQDDFFKMSSASEFFFGQDWNGGIPSVNDNIGSFNTGVWAGYYLKDAENEEVRWGDLITTQTYNMI